MPATRTAFPIPNIITESGRALTAHHSVLIFEVLETTNLPEWDDDEEVTENDHELLRELYGIWDYTEPEQDGWKPGTMRSRYAKRHSICSATAS